MSIYRRSMLTSWRGWINLKHRQEPGSKNLTLNADVYVVVSFYLWFKYCFTPLFLGMGMYDNEF